MSYCEQIEELTNVLIKSDDIDKKLKAKQGLLLICNHIPNIDDETKRMKITAYSKDIDRFLPYPKLNRDNIKQLKTGLKQQFGCESVQSTDL